MILSCELFYTTAEDFITALNDFFTKHDIVWGKCEGLSTDKGHIRGLQARTKTLALNMKCKYCCIHWEVLVAQALAEMLQMTLNEVVQIINYNKTRPQQCRFFAKIRAVSKSSFSFIWNCDCSLDVTS